MALWNRIPFTFPLLFGLLLGSSFAPALLAQEPCNLFLSFLYESGLEAPDTIELSLVEDGLEDPADSSPIETRQPSPTQTMTLQTAPLASETLQTKTLQTETLSLPHEGPWLLRVSGEGIWAPARRLSCGKAELRLYPAAKIEGTLEAAPNERLPTTLTASLGWASREQTQEQELLLELPFPCLLEEKRWSCRIPARPLNLQLKAGPFVPHFILDLRLEPGQIFDFGQWQLRRGAEIKGWVQVSERDGDLGVGAEVRARRLLAADRKGPGPGAEVGFVWKVRPKADGSFHFSGLEQGSYILSVAQEGLVGIDSAPLLVELHGRIDLSEPLRLRAPLSLEVKVSPPRGPDGAPWNLLLFETTRKRIQKSLSTDAEGRASFVDLKPGPYLVLAQDSSGRGALEKEVVLEQGIERIELSSQAIEVNGKIFLGETPLAATLSFGGERAAVSVPTRSKADGTFSVALPKAGPWNIDVRAQEPSLVRRLQGVQIEWAGGEEPAFLRIDLPSTELQGRTVDDDENPIGGATIFLIGLERNNREMPSQLKSGPEGGFRLEGLPTGEYRVEAHKFMDGQRWTSRPAKVEILEASSPLPTSLILAPPIKVTGFVESSAGPVPGSRLKLLAHRKDGSTGMLLNTAMSSTDGSFELSVPQEERFLVTVESPGFALHKEYLQTNFGRQLRVMLHQRVGTLHIELGEAASQALRRPSIHRDGEWGHSLRELTNWAGMNGIAAHDPEVLTAPFMPAGRYEACWPVGSWWDDDAHETKRCVERVLTEGSELTLRSPF